MPDEIPTSIIRDIISDWKRDYGPTYPLYGPNTVRHDISGSIRPLLSSTEISHTRILAEHSGISVRKVTRIISGEQEVIKREEAEKLLDAMDMGLEWYLRLDDYR